MEDKPENLSVFGKRVGKIKNEKMKNIYSVALTFLLFFSGNCQTKLFNDDGTYRTDGIYYINIENYITVDRNHNKIPYNKSQNYFIPIVFYKNLSQEYVKSITDYTDIYLSNSFFIFYKNLANTKELTCYWDNLEQLKYYILNREKFERVLGVATPKFDNKKYLYYMPYSGGEGGRPLFQSFIINGDKINYTAFANNGKGLNGNILATSENKLNFIEIYELSNDFKQKQLAEAKRIQEEKDRVNAIAQQKANAEAAKFEKINNDKRIAKIKTATIGDRLCYSESWSYTDRSNGFFGIGAYDNSSNYKVIVVAYIENIVNGKYQVRVGSIESTDNNHYQTPTYKGVKLKESTIHWVNPITDKNWYYCE